MSANQDVPTGFITVDEALELISKDTRTNPIVDISWLIRHYNYSRVGGNFTIPLLKRDKTGRIIKAGETFVTFPDEETLWKFRGALKRHYKELAGHDYDTDRVKAYTTTVDTETNPGGRVQVNKNPLTKAGQDLGSGTKAVNE